MMRHNFAVFILSHGRPDNIKTVKALKKGNYTGPWYIIIDDEDETEDRYRELYADKVIQFSKEEAAPYVDTADNLEEHRGVIYARNSCHRIARDLGVDYFLELDDDYNSFGIRYDEGGKLKLATCKDLDALFDVMLDFLDDTGALTVTFAQGGDMVGGVKGAAWRKRLMRKAMNTFFCKTDRPWQFYGRINEDTSAYVVYGMKGGLMFTYTAVNIFQTRTQAQAGGMTDLYLDWGTYLKTFYSVVYAPSCVKVDMMGVSHMRIHHFVNWDCCTPMILNQKWKKEKTEAEKGL